MAAKGKLIIKRASFGQCRHCAKDTRNGDDVYMLLNEGDITAQYICGSCIEKAFNFIQNDLRSENK